MTTDQNMSGSEDVRLASSLARAALAYKAAHDAIGTHFMSCHSCGANLRGECWYCYEHARLLEEAEGLLTHLAQLAKGAS